MRWQIEVIPVAGGEPETYCVETRQWQVALAFVRRLRGTVGHFGELSIDLVERGHRAVDPRTRVVYRIEAAPEHLVTTHSVDERERPSLLPPQAASEGVDPGPEHPRRSTPSVRPRPSSGAELQVPDHILLREGQTEPSAGAPFVYREQVLAVPVGTPGSALETLLFSCFRALVAALADRPPGKYIKLAVYDHDFEHVPQRPPLATLVWQDWRGDPVVNVQSDEERRSVPPPPAGRRP